MNGDVFVRAQTHGVGKTALADRAVVQSLFRDRIQPVLRDRKMPGGDQRAQTLGKIKKVNALVAHRQFLHRLKRHRLDEP